MTDDEPRDFERDIDILILELQSAGVHEGDAPDLARAIYWSDWRSHDIRMAQARELILATNDLIAARKVSADAAQFLADRAKEKFVTP